MLLSICILLCIYRYMLSKFNIFISQVHKIIGFAPTILQVVMAEQVDMPVRQAGTGIDIFLYESDYFMIF